MTDALNHNVGRNGLSVPFHGRRGVFSVVSFTSEVSKDKWEAYKAANMKNLKLLAVLINSASHINFNMPAFPVHLQIEKSSVCFGAASGETALRRLP